MYHVNKLITDMLDQEELGFSEFDELPEDEEFDEDSLDVYGEIDDQYELDLGEIDDEDF